MKLIDLLNENIIEEGLYSVTVDLMGPMKVQVRAKDEKEAKKLVASKLQRGMRDVKKVKKISERKVNEVDAATQKKIDQVIKQKKAVIKKYDNMVNPSMKAVYSNDISKLNAKLRKLRGESINEAINLPEGSHTIKTERFGDIRITVEENVTGPGFDQQLMVEVKHQKPGSTYLGHFIIEGKADGKGGKAKVEFKKGKGSVRLP